MSDDLVRLVVAAQRNDPAAFAELYAQYARMVHGILLARVPRTDVDDLVQDVFLQAMQHLPALRDPSAFGGWLASIARHRAVDYFRQAPKTSALTDDVAIVDEDRTEALAVLAIIRTLPEAYRETLTLRLVEGMTGPEIAARTGLTEGSVRVNLHRGMKQLRERLEEEARVTGDYLWDRTGWPDPELVHLEQVLGRLGARPGAAPSVARRARRWQSASVLVLTAAAVLALVVVSWREGARPVASLEVTRLAGTPTIASRPVGERQGLAVGRWLETDKTARASIDVASVGRVEVEPDTRIGLVSSRPGDYRLHLARGAMQAVIWAPPGQFSVATASSTAVDLGCVYSMTVDDGGVGLVKVAAGWVGFEWRGRESFIPAGAVCVTRPGLGPGTPHYEDTSEAFRAALTMIDVRGGSAAQRADALGRLLGEARPRDEVTLWHLLSRVEADQRDRVFDRLAALVPPPAEVTRDGIRDGRREMLDAWWNALNLGTTNWWRTWKQQWRDNWLIR